MGIEMDLGAELRDEERQSQQSADQRVALAIQIPCLRPREIITADSALVLAAGLDLEAQNAPDFALQPRGIR